MSSRRPIGYVVEIDGPQLLVNLLEDSRGHVAGHRDGLSTVEQPGDLVGIDAGAESGRGCPRAKPFGAPWRKRRKSLRCAPNGTPESSEAPKGLRDKGEHR